MRLFSRVLVMCAAASALATAVACGGSSDGSSGVTGPPGSDGLVTNGTFSATINGTAWSAVGTVVVNRSATNTLSIAGASTTYGVSFGLDNVTGPRTIALTASLADGNLAVVGSPTGPGWATGSPGGTGTVTITTLSASRVAGTFSFDAVHSPGGTAGTLQVRNGVFDLTF